jgi:hypothetical protein
MNASISRKSVVSSKVIKVCSCGAKFTPSQPTQKVCDTCVRFWKRRATRYLPFMNAWQAYVIGVQLSCIRTGR